MNSKERGQCGHLIKLSKNEYYLFNEVHSKESETAASYSNSVYDLWCLARRASMTQGGSQGLQAESENSELSGYSTIIDKVN